MRYIGVAHFLNISIAMACYYEIIINHAAIQKSYSSVFSSSFQSFSPGTNKSCKGGIRD